MPGLDNVFTSKSCKRVDVTREHFVVHKVLIIVLLDNLVQVTLLQKYSFSITDVILRRMIAFLA